MTVFTLSFIIVLLLGLVGFLSWKLYVAISIIAVFESDISDNISALDDVEKSIDHLVQIRMFFDSNDIQILVKEVMDSIKLAKLQIGSISKRFTDRSKNKYYLVEETYKEGQIDDFEVVPTNSEAK